MKRRVGRHGLTVIFAAGIAVCLIFGYRLEHKAFTPASPPGQAFAVVFVQDPAATLSLTALVNPDAPWRDNLTVRIRSALVKRDHWLLVIECPPGSANSPHPGMLVSEPAAQTPVPSSAVTVYSGAGPSRTVKLGCFIRTKSNLLNQSNTPGYASIGSVTLPALETDQAMESAVTAPTLYQDQKASGAPIHLIQVFPGAACPLPAPAVTQPTSTSPASSSGSAASGTSPPPGSAPAGGTTPAPTVGIPGCFGQAQAGTTFGKYYLPTSMHTKEILTNVNLTGYQVESSFPAPQITSDRGSPGHAAAEVYTWNGFSSLSPSLIVSNLAGQQAVSRYTFLAGVLLGIAGGVAATFLERIWKYFFPEEKPTNKEGPVAQNEISASGTTSVRTNPGPDGP